MERRDLAKPREAAEHEERQHLIAQRINAAKRAKADERDAKRLRQAARQEIAELSRKKTTA